jgi:monoamine oxidase
MDGRRIGQLPPDDRAEVVKRLVARLHPQVLEDGVVDEDASFFWDQYQWANGSFCELEPGQQATLHNDAVRPEAGVHFAGEHTSLDTGWIQGAVSSALRAVREIVAA